MSCTLIEITGKRLLYNLAVLGANPLCIGGNPKSRILKKLCVLSSQSFIQWYHAISLGHCKQYSCTQSCLWPPNLQSNSEQELHVPKFAAFDLGIFTNKTHFLCQAMDFSPWFPHASFCLGLSWWCQRWMELSCHRQPWLKTLWVWRQQSNICKDKSKSKMIQHDAGMYTCIMETAFLLLNFQCSP